MKALSVYILLLLTATNGRCQEGTTIDSLFRSLNKGEVSISERPLLFSDFNTMVSEDSTWYFVGDNIENINIAYCQAKLDKYACDLLQVNNRNYRLFANPDIDAIFDMDLKNARLYHIRAKNRKFVCITGGNAIGRGESGHIKSFVMLDITDPNKLIVAQLVSYSPSIYSFGDFNGDGELDFIKVKPDKKGRNQYIAEACDLDGEKITSGEVKSYFLLLSTPGDAAVVSDKRWF